MADLFAPKFQGDVAYERPLEPVQQPSALAALAGLGEFFVGQYGDKLAADAKASGSRGTKLDPNLAVFQQGLEKVEAIRQQQGESAALIAERRLASNFAMAGIDFDTSYQNVYKTTTGRQWAGYGRDTESFMRDEALKDPQVQSSFIASYAILPQDATEDQRLEYALGQKATLQAAADTIARSKVQGGVAWSTKTEAAYTQAIDTFLESNLGGLVATTQQGGRVGPQSLANLNASWSQLKVNISRPSGVTDDQWKAVQSKITNIDTMIANLQKASSSDVLFEEITTALANNLLKEGGGSTASILAAMTAIKDPSVLSTLGGVGMEQFIMDVGKGINLDITTPQLFEHVLSQPGAVGTDGGVVTVETLPTSIQSRVEGLTPQQMYDGLVASGQLTGLTSPNALQRPEGREQFVENAAGIGAVLMSMDNDQFLSADFLKKLVANPQFLRNVQTLEGVDPEGATTTKSFIVSGLNTERVRQERNLSATEGRATAATWNGQTYVVNRQDLEGRISGMRIEAFDRALTRYYNGDLAAAARDGYRRMTDVTDVIQIGGLYNLESSINRRDAIAVITNTVNTLNPPSEAPSPEGITYNVPEEVLQDTAFVGAAQTVADNIGIDVNDLFRVIEFETAGSWSPAIKAPTSSATGLIQFIESTANSLGTSTAELADMTRAQQMEYVEKYLRPYKGRIKNFGDLYMAIHWPKGVGKSDDYVMYSQGSKAYEANSGLDKNGDGTVTRGETLQRVMESTGGGMVSTPRTAAAEAALAVPAEELLPPQQQAPTGGGGAAPQTMETAPVQPVAPAAEGEQPPAEQPADTAFQAREGEQPARRAPAAPIPPEIRDLISRFTGTLEQRPLTEEEKQQLKDFLGEQ